ncbi:MAG: hypothetical protein H7240_02845 [Glaciimonas sp.]|nr:hypothetical protein [Glaciimonas sp.]
MSPSQLSTLALIFLCLNPFSYIPNDMRLMLAAGVMVIFGKLIKRRIIAKYEWTSIATASRYSSSRKIKSVYSVFVALFVHALLLSMLSIVSLIDSPQWNIAELVATSLRYSFSMLFSFLEVAAGYYLASHVSFTTVRKIVYGSFALMAFICIYQFLANLLNLPFVGNYVFDRFVGLRPSGLAAEPKNLSVYIVVLAFLLWEDRLEGKWAAAIRIGAICICVFLFLATSSGNGYVVAMLLMAVRLVMARAWNAIAVTVILTIGTYIFLDRFSLDDLGLRGSHSDLLKSLSDLDLLMFDDLIFLPLLAWRDNILNLLLGFGPGLLHYFAKAYISEATWVTNDVYIKGNISVINYISQFGIVVFSIIFFLVFSKARRLLIVKVQNRDRALDIFFINSFVIGAFISGNISIPFYLSIGWILSRSSMVSQLKRYNNLSMGSMRLPITPSIK